MSRHALGDLAVLVPPGEVAGWAGVRDGWAFDAVEPVPVADLELWQGGSGGGSGLGSADYEMRIRGDWGLDGPPVYGFTATWVALTGAVEVEVKRHVEGAGPVVLATVAGIGVATVAFVLGAELEHGRLLGLTGPVRSAVAERIAERIAFVEAARRLRG